MNSRWSADSSTNETTADRPARRSGKLREARIVEAHRDLGREVLELVAGQPELGEDDEVRRRRSRASRSRSWWVARLTSSDPSRGAIWASAMRSGLHARSIRDVPERDRAMHPAPSGTRADDRC